MSQEGCSTSCTSVLACYNSRYYLNVRINLDALALLPENGNLTGLRSVTLYSTIDDPKPLSAKDEDPYNAHLSGSFVPITAQLSAKDEDPYNAHLSGSFVPITAQRMTEQETIRQSVQERQPHQLALRLAPTML